MLVRGERQKISSIWDSLVTIPSPFLRLLGIFGMYAQVPSIFFKSLGLAFELRLTMWNPAPVTTSLNEGSESTHCKGG